MEKRTAFDYHLQLMQVKELISSLEYSLNMIKTAIPISDELTRQSNSLSEWNNYLPIRALTLAESELKKVYSSAVDSQILIEKKLSNITFAIWSNMTNQKVN